MGYIRRIFTFCIMFSNALRYVYVTQYCDDNKRILVDNEQLLYLLLQYSLYVNVYELEHITRRHDFVVYSGDNVDDGNDCAL